MNDKIKKNIYAALLGLAVLAMLAGSGSAYFYAQGSDINLKNTILVTGTGTITADPDEAAVYLGVQTQSADAVTAQQDNAQRMERIIKALEDAGILRDDIQTTSYYMYPVRDFEKPGQMITGFVVSNQLKVTVKDIEKVGAVIDTAVDAGANEVQSISFTLSDESKQNAREQALKIAVQAADSDASNLADALGVRITGPLQVSTSGGDIVVPYQAAETVSIERGVTTPIQPGEVSVSAYVQVTYGFI